RSDYLRRDRSARRPGPRDEPSAGFGAPGGPGGFMTPSTMKVVTGDRASAEEARIRAAYARRGGAWRYDWGNPAYVFMMHDLERRVLAALRRSRLWPLDARRILDVGCGTGYWLHRLIAWGAQPRQALGIHLLRARVRGAAGCTPRRAPSVDAVLALGPGHAAANGLAGRDQETVISR